MYVIKMMTNRAEGYKTVAIKHSLNEARATLNAMRTYHEPIDAYIKRVM